MRFRFLGEKQEILKRVFDIGLTLTLTGFLLNAQSLVVVNIRVVGLLLLCWALISRLVKWGWKGDRIPVWIHIGAIVVHIVVFIVLCTVLLSEEDMAVIFGE